MSDSEERTDSLRLRVPKPVYRYIKQKAREERRSYNQQTVIMLERQMQCETQEAVATK